MKKIFLTLVFAAGIFATAQEMELKMMEGDVPTVMEKSIDFGEVKKGSKPVEAKVMVTNTGKEALVISNAKASCGCTVPTYPKEPIMPGETKEMVVKYSSTYALGKFSKRLTIFSNAVNQQEKVLTVMGSIVD